MRGRSGSRDPLTKIGRNAPCPCGSGKKYKRCCGAASQEPVALAPPETDPELDRLDELDATIDLRRLLGTKEHPAWTLDFEIDPFDPVLDDAELSISADPSDDPVSELYERLDAGVRRHGTMAVRSQLVETLESRRGSARTRRARDLLAIAIAALENDLVDPADIGILRILYVESVLDALDDGHHAGTDDHTALDGALLDLAVETVEAMEMAPPAADGIPRLLEALEPLDAESALPYLEVAILGPSAPDADWIPVAELIARAPSLRSVALLELMAIRTLDRRLLDAVHAAMEAMAELAWPVLLYRLDDDSSDTPERAWQLESLVRAGVHEVFPFLEQELEIIAWSSGSDEPDEGVDLESVLTGIVALGDRRAIGATANILHRAADAIDPAVRAAIERHLRAAGWWDEVAAALSAEARGEIVFVDAGAPSGEVLRRRATRDGDPASIDDLRSRLGIAQEEWNAAYHEDLGWLRPKDIFSIGPTDRRLMEECTRRMREERDDHAEADAVTRAIERIQDELFETPDPSLDGRIPLTVILEEREASASHPARSEAYRRELLNRLYLGARSAFDGDDLALARRKLGAVLAIDPAHAHALRLSATLERRET